MSHIYDAWRRFLAPGEEARRDFDAAWDRANEAITSDADRETFLEYQIRPVARMQAAELEKELGLHGSRLSVEWVEDE